MTNTPASAFAHTNNNTPASASALPPPTQTATQQLQLPLTCRFSVPEITNNMPSLIAVIKDHPILRALLNANAKVKARIIAFIQNLPIFRRIFNGYAGNPIAKFTRFWKLCRLICGNYKAELNKLHERYGMLSNVAMTDALANSKTGPIVQVGPNEFSVSGHEGRLRFIAKQSQTAALHLPPAIETLEQNLKLPNLCRNEHIIEDIGMKLIAQLAQAAAQGQAVNVNKLVTRYAYDVSTAAMTGESSGYLDNASDPANIDAELKQWKVNSIICGSYLRFHPTIKSFLERFGFGKVYNKIQDILSISDATAVASAEQPKQTDFLSDDELESKIVLTLAGADPAAILMNKAIDYIYKTPDVLKRLRTEIKASGLPSNPSLNEIIHKKLHMPFLHAILLECKRLDPIYVSGLTHISPDDGITASGMQVPSGAMVKPIAVVQHINKETVIGDADMWRPTRWLSNATAELKKLVSAFNHAGSPGTVAEFHTITACKVIIQLFTNFNVVADDLNAAQIHSITSTQSTQDTPVKVTQSPSPTIGATTNINTDGLQVFEQYLGVDGTETMFKLFNPGAKGPGAFSRTPIRTRPFENNADLFRLRDAVKSVYYNRLRVEKLQDNTILLGTKGSVDHCIRNPRSRPQMMRAARPQAIQNTGWGSWAAKEHVRVEHTKSTESWAEQKQQIESKKTDAAANTMTFKQTFKQTGESINGELGGRRRVLGTEVTVEDGSAKANGGAGTEVRVGNFTSDKKPRAIPPHLKREFEADWVARSAVSPLTMSA